MVALGAILGVVIGLRMFRDINRFAVVSSVGALVSLVPVSSLGKAEGMTTSVHINLGFFRFAEENMIFRIGGVDHSWMVFASLVFIAAAGIAASCFTKVYGPPQN
ncbi:hypothetical protein [uncultured Roseobacter sp.]|uniref:hypothetical protein n=1 Tax=uncultured Roseobacter sp. TaxID=114847 RepID=UPI0026107D77|nr:hypothetical protein [uncultured Roseobacter sp.]